MVRVSEWVGWGAHEAPPVPQQSAAQRLAPPGAVRGVKDGEHGGALRVLAREPRLERAAVLAAVDPPHVLDREVLLQEKGGWVGV